MCSILVTDELNLSLASTIRSLVLLSKNSLINDYVFLNSTHMVISNSDMNAYFLENIPINLGISVETFDNNDLSQVMLKFYVVYEIYKRSIVKHKHYSAINEFYNCSNEDIIDYCVS